MMKKWLIKATDAVATIRKTEPREGDEAVAVSTAHVGSHKIHDLPPSQKLDLIVVPQSAIDAIDDAPHLLCKAVVDYVNHLVHVGQYTRSELPNEAMQIFHADYYCAQVLNGGHAQFVGNAGSELSKTLQDVMSGAMEMGHDGYHKIVSEMASWIAKNPRKALVQTGFTDGISEELAALDAPFFDLNSAKSFQSVLAGWIVDLEIVLAVPDAQLPLVYEGILLMNGKAAPRETARDIARYDHMLTDPLHLGLAHTGGSNKDPLIGISDGTQMEVKGRAMTCWLVHTPGGKRWGVINASGTALMEYIPGSNESLDEDISETTVADMETYESPKVGNLIASVSQDQINVARQVAINTKAAAAIELLLGSLDQQISVDCLSVRSAGRGKGDLIGTSIYVVFDGGKGVFTALVTSEGAKLLEEPTHKVLASVTRAEIDAHASSYTMPAAA
jgi:hypothetical protein